MFNKKFLLFLFFQLTVLSSVFAQKSDTIIYKTIHEIQYQTSNNEKPDLYIDSRCKLDIYYPLNIKDYATIVWFHGGSLMEGEKFFPKELMNQGIAIVAVNYRLSPKAQNPAYTEDAAAAVAWTFKNISKYGGSTSKLYISGHSAGAYLTLMVGLDKRWLKKYEIDADSIHGLFPVSAQTITHTTIRKERGLSTKVPVIDEYAPISHIRPDAPPIVLFTGGRDLELANRYIENAYFLETLKNMKYEKGKLYELNGFDHVSVLGPACYKIVEEIHRQVK